MADEQQTQAAERLSVPEPDCDAATDPEAAGIAELAPEPPDDALVEPFDEDEERSVTGRISKADFLKPGGSWGGSVHPARRALRIGTANGLTVTSRKRSWGERTSDHNVAQKRSFAVDLSNGSSPTPQMDRTAYEIARILGHPEWRHGILNERVGPVRMQLIWRWDNHYNHVHVGVRVD